MMKYNCDIVRDLMPLCVDGTASEPSRQMVGEHVLECRDCMQMYHEMRTEVPKEPPVDRDATPFRSTVRRLRRKRNKRRTLLMLAGVIVGLALVLGGLYVLHCMTYVYNHVSANGEYEFALYRRANGQIIYTMTNLSGRKQKPFYGYDRTTGVLSMYTLHPFIATSTSVEKTDFISSDLHWDEELGLMIRSYESYGYSDFPVLEVRQGGVYESSPEQLQSILYVQGQDIPLVSPDKDAAYDVLLPREPQWNGSEADLLPFMTPTPTALPMATVPPTLEPGNSATLPPHTTLDPAAHTDRMQSTMINHTDDLMLQKTLQTIITYREATSSDMAGSTPTPQPTALP